MSLDRFMNTLLLILVIIGNISSNNIYINDTQTEQILKPIQCKYVVIDPQYEPIDYMSSQFIDTGYIRKDFLRNDPYRFIVDNCTTTNIDPTMLYGLDLSDNELKQSDVEGLLQTNQIFSKSNRIKFLDLSGNYLENLNFLNDTLYSDLELLILNNNNNNNNNNETLNIHSLFELKKLKIVSLNNNNWSYFVFNGNELNNKLNLSYFGLRQNGIKSATNFTTFLNQYFQSLEHLDLYGNQLLSMNEFNKILFKFSIHSFNLESNKITKFNANHLVSMMDNNSSNPRTIHVNLKNNFISNTSLANFRTKNYNGSLIVIELRGNPLKCSCHSTWMLDELIAEIYKTNSETTTTTTTTALPINNNNIK
jgi:hypothetical protein